MWKFRELQVGQLERDPHESEFFNVGNLDSVDSLVREVIQNSLDARLPGENFVKVRFTLGHDTQPDYEKYYDGLIPHLRSAGFITPEPELINGFSFLTIEDFGTRGLDGPTNRKEITDQITSNYYNFWWREGKSQKTGQKAGRWGLGKTVFHVASLLKAFWGLTLRYDDERRLLLGKSVIDTHIYNDGKMYDYYGYFTGDNYSPIEA